MTIETEPYACIEIEHHSALFFTVNIVSGTVCVHMHPMIIDNIMQHGGYTPVNTKSCGLGLIVHNYMVFDIHAMVN